MKPRLLLIGDSIRMSYQPRVTELLGDAFVVVGPDRKNCRSTSATLDMFDSDIVTLKPDLVHWNNGLHDIKREEPGDPCAVPLDDYAANLGTLLGRLRKLVGPRIAWCRTSPVIEELHNAKKGFLRFERDAEAYNAAADALMAREGVPVHDLHAALAADLDAFIDRKDGVHLTEAGVEAAAQSVVRFVRLNFVNVEARAS